MTSAKWWEFEPVAPPVVRISRNPSQASKDVIYGRAPPKDGLVVLLASEANFSSPLLDLDRETAVLRGFPSCPRDFKRTSVERHFRAKGFALDWCEFRLLRLSDRSGLYVEVGDEEEEEEEEETQIARVGNHSTTSPGPPIEFPTKNELPLADLTFLYIQVHSVWFM